MSVDPSRGDSGQGPKWRQESENREPLEQGEPPRKWYDRSERFYVVLWVIFAVLIVALLIKRGGL